MGKKQSDNGFLTRQEILSANDLVYKDIPIKEWGGTVRIKSLTARDLSVYQAQKSNDTDKALAQMVILSVVGPDNQPLFTADDIDQLVEKNSDVIIRIANEINQLNKLRSIEENAENLEQTPG
jgi:hypothetical protein